LSGEPGCLLAVVCAQFDEKIGDVNPHSQAVDRESFRNLGISTSTRHELPYFALPGSQFLLGKNRKPPSPTQRKDTL
jgi:hypothetical protein